MIQAWTAAAIVTGVGMCVVEELNNTPETGALPQRIVLMTPGEIAWDGCECGQFAQSLQASFPSAVFPQDTTQQAVRSPGCESMIAFQVIASITRCVHGMRMNTNPPSPPLPADLLTDALRQAADAHALRNAVECCLLEYKRTRRIIDFRVGRIDAVGPEGNCAGVIMQYWFMLA